MWEIFSQICDNPPMARRIPSPGPGAPSEALLAALRRLLRPLLRLLIARGVTLPTLVALLKALYVEVAERDFQLPGKAQTDSRVSMLSGVHRKDVRRLRGNPGGEHPAPVALSTGIQTLSTWLGDPRFVTARGRPRVLPWRSSRPGEPSFELLVSEVSRQDIRARAVLDELQRQGMVEVDRRQRVRLCAEAFVPDSEGDARTVYFGRNLRDHIAAGVHNLLGGEPPLLDRSVHYSGLGERDVETLAEETRRDGMALLKAVNRRALAMKQANAGSAEATRRINFGLYFYSDESDQTVDDGPAHGEGAPGDAEERDA